jgi:hypothetical protein
LNKEEKGKKKERKKIQEFHNNLFQQRKGRAKNKEMLAL